MINYIKWRDWEEENKKYIANELFGVEAIYLWNKKNWEFFLYGYYDQNTNTYKYFAFDDVKAKINFEKINKIPWVWPLVAYQICFIPKDELRQAVDNFDLKFFQGIKWVWPKSAKRLLVELKSSVWEDDIKKLDIDQKLLKDITKTLKSYGYETTKVKKLLEECPIKMEKENLWEIIKRIIEKI